MNAAVALAARRSASAGSGVAATPSSKPTISPSQRSPADDAEFMRLPAKHIDHARFARTRTGGILAHQRLGLLQLRIEPGRGVGERTLRLAEHLVARQERVGQAAGDPLVRLPDRAPQHDQVLRREHAGLPEIVAFDRTDIGEQPQDRAIDRMIAARPRRAQHRVQFAVDQHLGQWLAGGRGVHAVGQGVDVVGDPRLIHAADPPLHLVRLHINEAQEMPVPDRAAGHPVVHADTPAAQIRRRLHRPILAHIQIAGGEIAQRKHRHGDVAAIALRYAAQMSGHRRLAALHLSDRSARGAADRRAPARNLPCRAPMSDRCRPASPGRPPAASPAHSRRWSG